MTTERGDPWLRGLMTDPYRIQVYREMLTHESESMATVKWAYCVAYCVV
eukprot:COSAG05_NODE_1767_length_4117_cov_8.548780_4_plen_49_part_00